MLTLAAIVFLLITAPLWWPMLRVVFALLAMFILPVIGVLFLTAFLIR